MRSIPFLFMPLILGLSSTFSQAETLQLVTSAIQYEGRSMSIGHALLAEINKHSPTQFELRELPSRRAELELMKGTFAGDLGRIKQFGLQHPELIRIAEPIAVLPHYAYSVHQNFAVKGWQSLQDHRVAIIYGHLFPEIYLQNTQQVNVHNPEHAVKMLASDRADVFVSSPFLMNDLQRHKPALTQGLLRLEPAIDVLPQFTYFHNKYAKAAKHYAQGLKAIKKNGRYHQILLSHNLL